MKALPIENVTARGFLSLDNYANLSAAHAWTDAGQFRSWLFIGVLGANSSPSVLVKVQQAKDILGTGVKDIPGKSYTHAAGKPKQFLVPYYIASHPGSDLKAMIELALFLKRNGYRPDQVQDFIPAPFDLATCMYHTGIDPMTVPKCTSSRR